MVSHSIIHAGFRLEPGRNVLYGDPRKHAGLKLEIKPSGYLWSLSCSGTPNSKPQTSPKPETLNVISLKTFGTMPSITELRRWPQGRRRSRRGHLAEPGPHNAVLVLSVLSVMPCFRKLHGVLHHYYCDAACLDCAFGPLWNFISFMCPDGRGACMAAYGGIDPVETRIY